jgi:hypothetical protein
MYIEKNMQQDQRRAIKKGPLRYRRPSEVASVFIV